MLDRITFCIKKGLVTEIEKVVGSCLATHSLEQVIRVMDQGIDDLTREWYGYYDWDGKARHPNPPVSYRDFDKAWDAYEVAWRIITSQRADMFTSRVQNCKQKSVVIGTGTLGNVHKAILRIDLHLRLKGWMVEFLGYELTPEDVLSREDELSAVVLSIMAHSAKVPALNWLKELVIRWQKPMFVGGSALRAIDAWLRRETNHVPYFVQEHSVKRVYQDIYEFMAACFRGAEYVADVGRLHESLLQVIHET